MSSRPQKNRSSRREKRPRAKPQYGGPPREHLAEQSAAETAALHSKAEQRFEVLPAPMGFPAEIQEPVRYDFEWDVCPVPVSNEAKVASLVVERGNFRWLEADRLEEISKIAAIEKMTLNQALSLRSTLLQNKTIQTHFALKSKQSELARHYRSGTSVVELSQRYDFAPMNLFRAILDSLGWSKITIKENLRDPSSMEQREQDEFAAAEAADQVSSFDQTESQARAELFEDVLAGWFEARGVRLRRQPEMEKEQFEQHGRPVRTPDLLFLDHVYINGQPIAWIDAKHFYGADIKFQRQKMKKQMNRYSEEWGSGAIVFRHSFSENLYIPGVLMLDGGHLVDE